MTDTRKLIRINDLRRPVLTDAARRLMADAERNPVRLNADAVLEAARQVTNLGDFGPDDFRERLQRWLQSAAEDTKMSALAHTALFSSCVQFASTRLRLHDLLRRHPEIHDVQIRQPIIVVGPPRSGTTYLQGLLAADSRLRSLQLWEAFDPIPESSEITNGVGAEPRFERYARQQERDEELLPYAAVMDPKGAGDMAEDLLLQLPDFPAGLDQAGAAVSHVQSYLAHDQTPHYEYMRTMLKALQWLRGPDRWVLKSPDHCEQLGPLLKVFPDAVVIITHRDPVAVVQSVATMKAYGARLRYPEVDTNAVFSSWMERIQSMLRSLLRDRHLINKQRLVDVGFSDIASNAIRAVEPIYAASGLELIKEQRERMLDFLARQERDKRMLISYNIRDDFGVEPDDVRRKFSFYHEWFPMANEVR